MARYVYSVHPRRRHPCVIPFANSRHIELPQKQADYLFLFSLRVFAPCSHTVFRTVTKGRHALLLLHSCADPPLSDSRLLAAHVLPRASFDSTFVGISMSYRLITWRGESRDEKGGEGDELVMRLRMEGLFWKSRRLEITTI